MIISNYIIIIISISILISTILISKINIYNIFFYFIVYLGVNIIGGYILFNYMEYYNKFVFYKSTILDKVLLYNLFFIIILSISYFINNNSNKIESIRKRRFFTKDKVHKIKKLIFFCFVLSTFIFVIVSFWGDFKYGLFDDYNRGRLFIRGGNILHRSFIISNYLTIILSGILLGRNIPTHKKPWYIFLIIICTLQQLLTGSRANTIFPILFIMFWYIIYYRKIRIKSIIIISIVLIIYSYVPEIRYKRLSTNKRETLLSIEDLGKFGSNILNTANLIDIVPSQYPYWLGRKMIIRPILSIFPNTFWNFIQIDSEQIKNKIDMRYSYLIGVDYGVRLGIIGDLYDNFGVLGILIGAYFLGLYFVRLNKILIYGDDLKKIIGIAIGITIILSINIDFSNGFIYRLINYALIPSIILKSILK